MKLPATLTSIMDAFSKTTQSGATPHRTPDFNALARMTGHDDPPVMGRFWFIEEHNTGYDGVLHRWQFFVRDKDDQRIEFWADLLPGLISSDKDEPLVGTGGPLPSPRRIEDKDDEC